MSETAQTLIKASLRAIGVIATGETPSAAEMVEGLESLKFMLRHWSDKGIRIPYQTQDTISLNGSQSYTIGTGGDCNTARPSFILGGFVRGTDSLDKTIRVVDADKYRGISLKNLGGTVEYVWYNPEYPLGKIYVYPTGGTTLYLDSLKPFSEPTAITSTIAFPPGYDEAIKWNLAVRLAPEYGKEPSSTVMALALAAMNDIETMNFAEQVVSVKLELIKATGRYNIDEG